MATPRRKNAPVELAESEILGRGLDTFAELGYEATTMRELARRLGVSHNFINDRYGSKAAFWRAAVDFALYDVQPRRNRLLARHHDDAGVRLQQVIGQLYRMAAAAGPLNRLIADESTRDSDRLDYLHQQFIKPFWDSIEPTLAELMTAGRMPRVAAPILYFAITGPALALAQNPLANRIDPNASPNPDPDALANLVLRGLLPADR